MASVGIPPARARPRYGPVMGAPSECYTCSRDADPNMAPHERIAADGLWRVAHAIGTGLPGWLVLIPRRHVTSIADLTDEEAAALGAWQVRLSRALHAVTGCQKTYVAQFAEAPGFAHVHFHIMPRPADLADSLRGPRIFGLMGPPEADQVPAERMNEIAAAVSRYLGDAAN
jgi:diadenosine tetraphosphate (Ap4A) HIT family hydrolase